MSVLLSQLRSPYLRKFFQAHMFGDLQYAFISPILGEKEQEIMPSPRINNWVYYCLASIDLIRFLITASPPILLFAIVSTFSIYYTYTKITKAIDNLFSANKLAVTLIRLFAALAGAYLGFNIAIGLHLILSLLFPVIGAATAIIGVKYLNKAFSYFITGHSNTGIENISPSSWARIRQEQDRKFSEAETRNLKAKHIDLCLSNGDTLNIHYSASYPGGFIYQERKKSIPIKVINFARKPLLKFKENITLTEQVYYANQKKCIGTMKGILAQIYRITSDSDQVHAKLGTMYNEVKNGNLSKIEEYKSNFFINLYDHYRQKDIIEGKMACEERKLIAAVYGVPHTYIDNSLYGDEPVKVNTKTSTQKTTLFSSVLIMFGLKKAHEKQIIKTGLVWTQSETAIKLNRDNTIHKIIKPQAEKMAAMKLRDKKIKTKARKNKEKVLTELLYLFNAKGDKPKRKIIKTVNDIIEHHKTKKSSTTTA